MSRARLLPILVLVAACTGAVPEAEPFLGVWASEGWGILLHVHGGDADIYEVSATQCLLAVEGSARNIDQVAALDAGRLVLREGGRVIRFDLLPALPAGCGTEPDAAPQSVLREVVTAFEEHYLPGVDAGWSNRVASLPSLSPGDATALEAAIRDLLSPLGDPAIALQAGGGSVWSPQPPGAGADLAAALLAGRMLPSAVAVGADGIVTTELEPGVQYLGFLRMGGFASSTEGSQRVVAAALDQALRTADAVIIDLRSATAGSEVDALLVATRFVEDAGVVATTAVRLVDGSTAPAGDVTVNPMPTGRFAGSVVVLIGPGTAGPAELLALVLSPLPGVTLVGEPTAGSPRTPLVRTLPNGWVLGVPNTEVLVDGTARAGVPLSPDIVAPLSAADVTAGSDPGLAAAMAALAP